MKALIINDTSPSRHLGCVLVMQQLADVLKDNGFEIQAALRPKDLSGLRVQRELAESDVMIINGEGTMHHDAADACAITRAGQQAFSAGVPVALINTVWQDNDVVNSLLPYCKWIAARESLSANTIRAIGHRCSVIPDLTLCSKLYQHDGSVDCAPNPDAPVVVLDGVRRDLSATLAAYAKGRKLTFMPMGSRPSLRNPTAWPKWWQQSWNSGWAPQLTIENAQIIHRSSIVLTGRFHGICLAILAKRPFIAFSSNTHKMEGILADAKLGPGAILLPDPPADKRLAMIYLDNAVKHIAKQISSTEVSNAYNTACEAYITKARLGSKEIISQIAYSISKNGRIHA